MAITWDEEISEQERLSQIFLENEDLIRSIISIKLSNRQEAEDIFQDFFLSFITSPPKNHDNLRAYIQIRLKRDVIDHARKSTRYRKLIDSYSKAPIRKTDCNETPAFNAIVKEEQTKMLTLLSENLAPPEAKAIKLRHLDEYNTAETSKIMNVKKRSASRYLAVGMKKLRNLFEKNLVEIDS